MYSCICCGSCCKNHLWLVTFRDLREIRQNYPEIKLESLITLYVLGEEYRSDEMMRYNAPIQINYQNWPKEGYLGLIPQKINGQNHCPFLNSDTNKCNIYPHRPMLCRKFPYGYDSNQEFIIQRIQCPGRKKLSMEEVEEISTLIDSVWESYTEFRNEIKFWNEKLNQKSISEFLSFIFHGC